MVASAAHSPAFETLDAFRPRMWVIVQGSLLTLLLFLMSVFAIRYSWIHVLNLRFPEVVANEAQPIEGTSAKSSKYREIDVLPSEPADARSKTVASTVASASPRPRVSAATPAATGPTRGVTLWLDSYVGKYVSINPPAKIWIQIESDPLGGDRLSLSFAAGSHSGLALTPVSPTRFVIGETGFVNFTGDAQGSVSGLILVVGGKLIAAERK